MTEPTTDYVLQPPPKLRDLVEQPGDLRAKLDALHFPFQMFLEDVVRADMLQRQREEEALKMQGHLDYWLRTGREMCPPRIDEEVHDHSDGEPCIGAVRAMASWQWTIELLRNHDALVARIRAALAPVDAMHLDLELDQCRRPHPLEVSEDALRCDGCGHWFDDDERAVSPGYREGYSYAIGEDVPVNYCATCLRAALKEVER